MLIGRGDSLDLIPVQRRRDRSGYAPGLTVDRAVLRAEERVVERLLECGEVVGTYSIDRIASTKAEQILAGTNLLIVLALGAIEDAR